MKSAHHRTDAFIVYDGECLFCSKSMAWVARHDRGRRVRFTACTSDTGSGLMREHGIDPADPYTFLVIIEGQAFVRTDAMLRVVAMLDRKARPLRLLRIVPRPVRDAIYDWTARNRRRILRSTECPMPTADMRDRLIA